MEGLVALTHRYIEMFMADECGGECREMSGCWDEWDGMNGMGWDAHGRHAQWAPCRALTLGLILTLDTMHPLIGSAKCTP